jgi:hypothetical protein
MPSPRHSVPSITWQGSSCNRFWLSAGRFEGENTSAPGGKERYNNHKFTKISNLHDAKTRFYGQYAANKRFHSFFNHRLAIHLELNAGRLKDNHA